MVCPSNWISAGFNPHIISRNGIDQFQKNGIAGFVIFWLIFGIKNAERAFSQFGAFTLVN